MELSKESAKRIQRDNQLVDEALNHGDQRAYTALMESHKDSLYYMIFKMVNNPYEAEDLTIEAFGKAFRNLSEFSKNYAFSTWLYTIATRLCLDHLKGMKHIVPLPDDESVLRQFAANADSQRTLENSEWVAIVRKLTEGLSEKQRLVFTLCQLEGLSSQEVTQITGLDASQVKSNLYVARQTIRKQLKALGYGQD